MITPCEKMQRLRKWLNENDVSWAEESEGNMSCIRFSYNRKFYLVINRFGSCDLEIYIDDVSAFL